MLLEEQPDRLLVVDEAYAPFVDNRWRSERLLEFGNLVILRSMTKDQALAGLRLGYLLAATASGLVRFNPESGERQVIPAPNATEEFKTIARDSVGRIWTAGDLLYASFDEGKHWSVVRMPMLSPTYIKRIREVSPGILAIALHDRGVVFVNRLQSSHQAVYIYAGVPSRNSACCCEIAIALICESLQRVPRALIEDRALDFAWA